MRDEMRLLGCVVKHVHLTFLVDDCNGNAINASNQQVFHDSLLFGSVVGRHEDFDIRIEFFAGSLGSLFRHFPERGDDIGDEGQCDFFILTDSISSTRTLWFGTTGQHRKRESDHSNIRSKVKSSESWNHV